MDLRVNSWLVIPDGELRERFSRSSGPGGQSVNTADSRVELSFDVEQSPSLPGWARSRALERLGGRLSGGVLTIAASEQRSQLANRQAARARLAALLRDAVAPPQRPRVPTRPSRSANERRLEAKRGRSAVKRTRRYDSRDPELAARTAPPRSIPREDPDHVAVTAMCTGPNAVQLVPATGFQDDSGPAFPGSDYRVPYGPDLRAVLHTMTDPAS